MNLPTGAPISKSIRKAIGFLTESRDSQGLWSDFRLPVGESTGWVTGFVGSSLAATGDEKAVAAAREAWQVFASLNFLKGHGGWGYNKNTPEDADSTAWGIRLAELLGLGEKMRTHFALEFLGRHLIDDGGITTYILEHELRNLIGASSGEDISGWTRSHTCVTAAAAGIATFNATLLPYLLAQQEPEGNWNGYWWSDSCYTTSLAAEALCLSGRDKHRPALDRAYRWTLEQFGTGAAIPGGSFPGGSPFATALGLRTLLLAGDPEQNGEKAGEIVGWLTGRQKENGSWQSSAVLQVPPPFMKAPVGPETWHLGKGASWGTVVTDQHALFTTAAVLGALVLYRKNFATPHKVTKG
jgi:squalene cyclase